MAVAGRLEFTYTLSEYDFNIFHYSLWRVGCMCNRSRLSAATICLVIPNVAYSYFDCYGLMIALQHKLLHYRLCTKVCECVCDRIGNT